MLWNRSICRLCMKNSVTIYYIYEQEDMAIKLQRYLRLNVHKGDSKPNQICNGCYVKLEGFIDFIDMCHESNNKLETINNNDDDKNVLDSNWKDNNEGIHVKGDVLAVLDTGVLDLEMNHLDTNVIDLNVDLGTSKSPATVASYTYNNTNNNQSVVRHSSEYAIATDDQMDAYCNRERDREDAQFQREGNILNVQSTLINDDTVCCDVNTTIIKMAKQNNVVQQSIRKLQDNKIQWDSIEKGGSLKGDNNVELVNNVGQGINAKEHNYIEEASKQHQGIIDQQVDKELESVTVELSINKNVLDNIDVELDSSLAKNYHCEYCKKKFKRKKNLKSHLSTLHTNLHQFKCDSCSKTFTNKRYLTCHQKLHTNLFECKYCDKRFSFRSKLERHVRIHTNDRPYVCKFKDCTKKFSDKRNLIAHETIHVENVKNYNCKVCDKCFKTNKELKQHDNVHVDRSPYKCNVCCKSYKFNTNLLIHMMKHDGYYCKYCKIDFIKLTKLLKHRKECKLKR